MPILRAVATGLALLALWLASHEYKLRKDHRKGDSCKQLALGQENPLWEDELKSVNDQLEKTLARIMNGRVEGKLDDPNPGGRWKRVQHPTTWGCASATIEMFELDVPGLEGIFGRKKSFDAMVRLSKNAFDPDNWPKVSAIAIKIFGVDIQPRATMKEWDSSISNANKDTLDILAISSPTLPIFATPSEVLTVHEDLMQQGGLILVSFHMLVNRPTLIPRLIKAILPGWTAAHPFHVKHYTASPYRLGPGMAARLGLFPCDPNEPKGHFAPRPERDYIAGFAQEYLNKKDVCMKLMYQLQRDPCEDQVDDFIDEWKGPWKAIGELRIKRGTRFQVDDSCDNLSFNPYHAPEVNKPLGWVNRLRREAYAFGAGYRVKKNAEHMDINR